jgi:hypothetical protein
MLFRNGQFGEVDICEQELVEWSKANYKSFFSLVELIEKDLQLKEDLK